MSTTAPSQPAPWWRRLYGFGLELWGILRSPSTVFSLGTLVLAGFIAGVVFWGGFNTAMELTNREAFCVSCHEMRDNVFEDLKRTVHYANRSGVRATCPDCHVPHEWTDKIARKMQASKEVWGKVFGTIAAGRRHAHQLPDMTGIDPGWKVPSELQGEEAPKASF